MKTFQTNTRDYNGGDVFIIGNGASRKEVDLEQLKGVTIGCNYIYKDFIPTILTSICYHIINHIIKYENELLDILKVPESTMYLKHYNVKRLQNRGCWVKGDVLPYITTGNFAVDYAIKHLQPEKLHLIGFDNDNTNVYQGHQYYSRLKGTKSTNWNKNLNQLNYILRKYEEC